MKLSDLKKGMICKLRNDYEIIILSNNTYVFDYLNHNVYLLSKDYNDDLTYQYQNDYDIIKVSYGDKVLFERQEINLFFEPKKQERYYYINEGGVWSLVNDSNYDDAILRTNIVFKTKEEAEKELLKQQARVRVIKEIARLNNGWTPSWNVNERKYYIDFSYYRNKLVYNHCVKSKHLDNNLYLKTEELAKQLIETHSEDLKLMLEVE